MKNKFIIGTVLASTLLMTTSVEAMGNAKVEFTSNNNIQVGDTFTVSMSVTDINDTYDGIVSLGGNLSFDSTMVEYISSKGIETPYLFQINEDYGYKIAGLDFTLDNGIRETLTVYEFTFKALKEGNTTITLTNVKLTDSKDYINTTVLGKEIIIEKEETIITETPIVETKTETPNTKETSTVKVVETKIENKIEKKVNDEEIKEEIQSIEEVKQVVAVKQEKENFMETIQKVFNDLINQLRNLFK